MDRDYEKNTWMAWIPIVNCYIQAKFLQEQNGEKEWLKWIMAFYGFAGYIPIIGSFIMILVGILIIIQWMKYLYLIKAPAYLYIIYFIISMAFPYVLNYFVKKTSTQNRMIHNQII